MHTFRTTAAALLVAGVTLIPSIAGADPLINAPAAGNFQQGDTAHIQGTDCVAPGGGPTWGGVFVQVGSDPAYYHGIERQAVDGAFEWVGTTDDLPTGDVAFTFYCSAAPVTEMNPQNPDLLWVSAPYDVSFIEAAPEGSLALRGPRPGSKSAAGAMERSLGAGTGVLAKTLTGATHRMIPQNAPSLARPTLVVSEPSGSSQVTLRLEVDPDSLPVVDRMGIPGPAAAKLKDQVDQTSRTVERIQKRYAAITHRRVSAEQVTARLPRPGQRVNDNAVILRLVWASMWNRGPSAATDANADYVAVADYVVGHRGSSGSFTEALNAGQPRVQVIEDIALTVHDAAWWMRRS